MIVTTSLYLFVLFPFHIPRSSDLEDDTLSSPKRAIYPSSQWQFILKTNMLSQEENKIEVATIELTFGDIMSKIWTSPRTVFNYVKKNANPKHVLYLLVLAGINNSLDKASSKNLGDNMSLTEVLMFSIIIGGLIGWISLMIYAHLIRWTGSWLKGTANSDALINILAYSMIPSIMGLFLLIVQIGLFGNSIFRSDFDLYVQNGSDSIIVLVTGLLQLALALYTFALLIIGISEVQNFSIGKSILNALLPVLVFLVPIILIVIAIDLFK